MRTTAPLFGLALTLAAPCARASESGGHLGADEGLTNGTVGETVDLNTVLVFALRGGYRVALGERLSLDLDLMASYEPRKASPTDRITLLTALVGPRLYLHASERWSLFAGAGIGPLWIFDVQAGDVIFENPESKPSANPLLLLDFRGELGLSAAIVPGVELVFSASLDSTPAIEGLVGGLVRRTFAVGVLVSL
jgi:hypothetical protein